MVRREASLPRTRACSSITSAWLFIELCAFVGDQLRRAATSITFNIAEGAGEFRPNEKARFYRLARRSATESASILDALRIWPRLEDDSAKAKQREECLARGRDQLIEIVSMLIKLARRLDDRAN